MSASRAHCSEELQQVVEVMLEVLDDWRDKSLPTEGAHQPPQCPHFEFIATLVDLFLSLNIPSTSWTVASCVAAKPVAARGQRRRPYEALLNRTVVGRKKINSPGVMDARRACPGQNQQGHDTLWRYLLCSQDCEALGNLLMQLRLGMHDQQDLSIWLSREEALFSAAASIRHVQVHSFLVEEVTGLMCQLATVGDDDGNQGVSEDVDGGHGRRDRKAVLEAQAHALVSGAVNCMEELHQCCTVLGVPRELHGSMLLGVVLAAMRAGVQAVLGMDDISAWYSSVLSGVLGGLLEGVHLWRGLGLSQDTDLDLEERRLCSLILLLDSNLAEIQDMVRRRKVDQSQFSFSRMKSLVEALFVSSEKRTHTLRVIREVWGPNESE